MKKILFIILIASIFIGSLYSQNYVSIVKDSFFREFIETQPPVATPRSIAEFEPMEAVIVKYPLGVPVELIVELSQLVKVITLHSGSSVDVQNYYQTSGVNIDNCVFKNIITDSYWARDFSPWFIFDGNDNFGIVNFIYNRPRPNDNDVPINYGEEYSINVFGMPLEQTGGNYMSDGMGKAVSTEIAFTENSSLTEDQVREYMQSYLGIIDYDIVNDPQGDYIKHVDCWGKYLDVDKILIASVPEDNPRYSNYEAVATYFQNKLSSYGTPYQVIRIPSLANDYTPTPYTNSLIINDHVFVPVTGTQNDQIAIEIYQNAMPGYTIVPISNNDSNIGWLNTDALHCRTHEVPDDEMIYIYHIPLNDESSENSLQINANIKAYSGGEITRAVVKYKINSQEYISLDMVPGNNNKYSLTLPEISINDTISYYIHVEDSLGKVANHPYIGGADPHMFIAGSQTAVIETNKDDNILNVFPNPFNPKTKIFYYLNSGQNISLNIYNVRGQKVKEIYKGFGNLGRNQFVWNGKDENNEYVSSGIYFVKLLGENFVKTHKIMLIK